MSTVHSQRLDAELHLGKRDAQPPASSHVPMRELLAFLPAGTLPPIPASFGTGYDFGQAGWSMLGNGPDDTVTPGFQGCGDCDWAASAHILMQAAHNAKRPIPAFSGKTVVAQYSAYSGYDPATGSGDNGTDMQESLTWCQTKGFQDDAGTAYKFGKSVSLTPGNLQELWAATYLFEDAKIGVQLQAAQMDQFDAHQPWDFVKGSAVDGGHAIPTMGVNGLISWGERVGFTQAFIKNLMDEGYSFLLAERYNAVTGETLEDMTDADLEKYLSLLTAQKLAA